MPTLNATNTVFEADYTEPTKVVTGSALTNLSSTTVYYTISIDGAAPGIESKIVSPATAATGGGLIKKAITDNTMVPGHNYVVRATCTASNPAGESARSAVATLTVNRSGEVVPTPVTGLTLA